MYARGIEAGDLIYYKRSREKTWSGPNKVIGVSGKKLFIDRGGHMATVNKDDAVRKGEEFWRADGLDEKDVVEHGITNHPMTVEISDFPDRHEFREVPSEESAANQNQGETNQTDDHVDDDTDNVSVPVFNHKLIRKGDSLKFTLGDSNEQLSGKVMSRAGKVGGVHESWWNIKTDNGEQRSYDSSQFSSVQKITEEITPQVETAFVVQIPRYLHNDPKCMQAKLKELDSWDEFHVYDEVKDVGQQRLGTNWILTEKVIDGELAVKARLCVRGDQEMESFRTDSPTVHKDSINVFFMVAAKNGRKIQTADIKCAFLQGKELDRDVFVRPPKERRIPGVIWKMLKRTYGFTDASRGFYLELSKALKDLGCIQSTLDPAVFLYFGKGKSLEGVTLTHVDDLLHGSGTDIFYRNVMKPLKEIFKFGTEEVQEFRYVGTKIRQIKNAIVVDQDHYIRAMEFPDHDEQGGSKLLDGDRQSE